MDDVWGNAWAQPEEDVAHSLPTKHRTNDTSAWSPSDEKSKHEEADVGIPSWSTGELNWTESTGEASLWSSASTVDDLALEANGWGTSSGLNTKLNSQVDDDEHADSFAPRTDAVDSDNISEGTAEREEQDSRSSTPVSAGTVTSVTNAQVTTMLEESVLPPIITPSSIEVPEVVDTFESFKDEDTSVSDSLDEGRFTWASPVAAFEEENGEADAWGSAWKASDLGNTNDAGEEKDEWTLAREQKARRDRSVPPELLATIIDHLNGLAEDLWKGNDGPHFDQSLGNWRDGLGNAVGLEELVERALPETTSQPPVKLSGSHTAKAMAKSIKFSKNLPIVRNSPLSHLFTAKSLAAWELSVKSKTEVIKDDIPAGWRAIEPEHKQESKPAPTEKRSTGIFSFFSKRTSSTASPTSTTGGADSKRSSLSREVTSDAASVPSLNRNSSDATSLSGKLQQSSSVTSLSSIPAPLSSPGAGPSSTKAASSPSPSTAVTSQAPSESVTQPAPSAVYRFFNRFSRSRSDTRSSSASPRSSIALSTDDLEFLSDIVPSHSDDADEDQQLHALTALVSSPVQPTKLPPPLAPPPLAPPPRPSSLSRATTPHPVPQSHPLFPTPVSSANSDTFDPLGGLADLKPPSPDSIQSVVPPLSKGTSQAALPPPLPPPLSPTSVASLSKPPTPSPLSGGISRAGHSRTSTSSSIRSSSVSPAPPRITSPRPAQSPLSAGATSTGSVSVASPASSLNAQSLSASNFSPLSAVPPPPIEKSPNRNYAPPRTNLLEDNDEFSEFQSYGISPAPASQTSARSSENQSLFDMSFDATSNNANASANGLLEDNTFGDFGSFVSHPPPGSQNPSLRSPPSSPLSPPLGVPPPLPRKQPPANLNTLHVRRPSAADHDATARLLERAAARPGRWPAPPSPIPNPLPPPPSSGANSRTSTSGQSLLELDDGAAQAPIASVPSIPLKPIVEIVSPGLAPSKAVSPPPLLPPPGSGTKQHSTAEASLLDLDNFTKPVHSHVVKTQTNLPLPTSSAGSAKSGLSAQDLSFFEGL